MTLAALVKLPSSSNNQGEGRGFLGELRAPGWTPPSPPKGEVSHGRVHTMFKGSFQDYYTTKADMKGGHKRALWYGENVNKFSPSAALQPVY